MLYYSSINSSTLELLKQLLAVKEFANLRLVGGTSLALQIGHRISVDLDLEKYADGAPFLVLKSLSYFDDAENELNPNLLINISWVDVKKFLTKSLSEYFRISR